MAESGEVVAYVIKVDAKRAEKALASVGSKTGMAADNVVELGKVSDKAADDLKEFATEATTAAKASDKVATSVNKSTKGVQKFGKQSKISQKNARAFRRAGRDIDGAMGDLSQGLGLVNPGLAAFAMQISSAASVTDGLGRTLTAVTNPAFLLTVGSIGIFLAAIELYNHTVGEAKAVQQKFNDEMKLSNEIIQKQKDLVAEGVTNFDNLGTALTQAQAEAARLRGELTEQEVSYFKIANAVEQQRTAQQKANRDIIFGLKRQQLELDVQERQIAKRNLEEGRSRGVGTGFIRKQRAFLDEEIKQREAIGKELDKNAKLLTRRLQLNEKIKQGQKEEEENRKKAAEARAKNQREAEKAAAQAEKNAQAEFAARQQILQIDGSLSAQIEIINNQRDQAIKQAQKLAKDTGNEALFLELQEALRDDALKQVNELIDAQKQNTDELDKQIKKQEELKKQRAELIATTIGDITSLASDPLGGALDIAARQAPQVLSGIGDTLFQVGTSAAASGASGLSQAAFSASGAAASGAAMAAPIAMAVVEGIKTLGAIGQKTPEELREEAKILIDNIITGLEILPAILVQVLPPILLEFIFRLNLALQQLPFLIIDAIIDGVAELFRQVKKFFTDGAFREAIIGDPIEDAKEFFRRVFDPDVAAFAGGGRMISAQGGIRFTGSQRTSLAQLHAGEFVVPQSGQRPQQVDRALRQQSGAGVVINVNGTLVERNALDELVRRLEQRFGNFGAGQTSLFGRS